jgi:uncharacterized delta-60 repeat protein
LSTYQEGNFNFMSFAKTPRSVSALVLVTTVLLLALVATAYAQDAGDFDTSFDVDGKVLIDFGDVGDFGYASAVQPDGKMVIAGKSFNGVNDDFALVRLNADGSLDTSFDGDGKVRMDFSNSNDGIEAIALQPDGKIVVAGYTFVDGDQDFALARYNADGSPDATFSTDGKVNTNTGPADKDDFAMAVAIQTDGKIVAAGQSNPVTFSSDGIYARYNADGTLDFDFGASGITITPINSSGVSGVVVDNAGKVVGSDYSGYIFRLNADGTPDTTFDTDGNLYLGSAELDAVALYPGGRYVTVGDYFGGFEISRITSNGTLDNTLSNDGQIDLDDSPDNYDSYSIAIDSAGRILLGGATQPNSTGTDFNFVLARLNPDGTPDLSFSQDGKLTTSFGPGVDIIHAVIPFGDYIYVAGEAVDGINVNFAAARFYAISIVPTASPTNTPGGPTNTPGAPTATAQLTPTGEPGNGIELVTNNSFETDINNDKIPDGWTAKNLTKDRLMTNKAPDKLFAYDGVRAWRFKGNIGEASKLQYKVPSALLAAAGAGDSLSLSAYIDTTVASPGKLVTAKVKYTTDDKTKVEIDLTSPTSGYQQLSKSGTLSANVASIKVQINYKGTSGKVLIDLVNLKLNEGNSLLPLP